MQEHESVTLHYAHTDYRRQGIIALVRDHVTGAEVLDLRCLEGGLTVPLAVQGKRVVGLDGFREAVDQTNAWARRAGVPGDLAHVWNLVDFPPAAQKSFDCIICADLLNHVPDERRALADITQRLRSGGRLILVVPAVPAMLGKRDQSLGHLRRFTRAQITALLADYGLEMESCRYWNALAFPAYALIEKILGRRLTDNARFKGSSARSVILGPLLRFWYTKIEKRLSPPFGLSFFIVARKR